MSYQCDIAISGSGGMSLSLGISMPHLYGSNPTLLGGSAEGAIGKACRMPVDRNPLGGGANKHVAARVI